MVMLKYLIKYRNKEKCDCLKKSNLNTRIKHFDLAAEKSQLVSLQS